MARRRARVALPKWLEAFAATNEVMADLLKQAEARHPEDFNFFGSGAIIRIIVNHLILPKVHEQLLKNPNADPREVVKKVLATLTPAEVMEAVKKRWPTYPYADKVAKAFEDIKEVITATATA